MQRVFGSQHRFAAKPAVIDKMIIVTEFVSWKWLTAVVDHTNALCHSIWLRFRVGKTEVCFGNPSHVRFLKKRPCGKASPRTLGAVGAGFCAGFLTMLFIALFR